MSAQQALRQDLGPTKTDALRRILGIATSYLWMRGEAVRRGRKGLEARGIHALALAVEPGMRGEAQAEPRLRAWLDAHV